MPNLQALMKLAGAAITGIVTLGVLEWLYRAARPETSPRRRAADTAPAP